MAAIGMIVVGVSAVAGFAIGVVCGNSMSYTEFSELINDDESAKRKIEYIRYVALGEPMDADDAPIRAVKLRGQCNELKVKVPRLAYPKLNSRIMELKINTSVRSLPD